jgi:hypothetical protein
MSIQLIEEKGGKVLVLHISDKLVTEDYERFVPEFERLVGQHGKLRLLFEMTDFLGWDAGASWDDTRFVASHFSDVSRLAMVGDKTCQRGMAMFCRPFTRAAIRYFDRADASKARQWLDRV